MRIPGGFCGIFSLKPTPERISYKDCGNTVGILLTPKLRIIQFGQELTLVEDAGSNHLSLSGWIPQHLG